MDNDLIKILEQERHELLRKLNLIEETIIAYRNSGIIFLEQEAETKVLADNLTAIYENKSLLLQKYQNYNRAHPVRKKIVSIIFTENRFLHVREIARILQQLEAEASLNFLIRKVSPALSMLKKIPDSPIISVAIARSQFNTFWGCKEWLTENGEIKQPFMYNEKEIKKMQKENFFI